MGSHTPLDLSSPSVFTTNSITALITWYKIVNNLICIQTYLNVLLIKFV